MFARIYNLLIPDYNWIQSSDFIDFFTKLSHFSKGSIDKYYWKNVGRKWTDKVNE